MRYTEIKPAVQLARFIECYWTLESDGSASSSPPCEPILPDGCVELILNFGARFVEHYDGKVMRQPKSFLVGQMTRPMLIAPTGSVCVIGIRFHPGGTEWLCLKSHLHFKRVLYCWERGPAKP
jgi:hypothetical protein